MSECWKLSAFKLIAPFSIFCNVNYIYNFDVDVNQKRNEGVLDKVETGNRIGFNAGIVYSLSENTAFCLEYPYAYSYKTKYQYKNAPPAESSGGSSIPILYIGVGWKFFQKNYIILKTGIPLSGDGPDFQLNERFSFRTPSFCF
ncbi:MAG: hypothetical protein PF482_14960 [Desulfobacteraceae bacterium]|nr:hypothetical protein [Desulfobacteraceae bacterium]